MVTRPSSVGSSLLGGAITFSIVSHGHGREVDCLLRDLDLDPAFSGVEVVVTHNVPEPSNGHPVFRHLRVSRRYNKRVAGFGENHNVALRECSSPLIGVLNPDVRIASPGAFAEDAIRLLESPPIVALRAPVIVGEGNVVQDYRRALITPLDIARRALGIRNTEGTAQEFTWYAGACLLIRTSAFRSVGGFDQRYFLYCEDFDLCARLALAGFQLVDGTARVEHSGRRASKRSLNHLRHHVASLLRVWTSSPFYRLLFRR